MRRRQSGMDPPPPDHAPSAPPVQWVRLLPIESRLLLPHVVAPPPLSPPQTLDPLFLCTPLLPPVASNSSHTLASWVLQVWILEPLLAAITRL